MSPDLMINMSDQSIAVYAYEFEPLESNEQIGTIYPKEAYSYRQADNYEVIWFRNKNGKLALGYIPVWYLLSGEIDPKFYTPCTDYPYGTAEIEGKTYYTFMFRRTEEVYTAAETRWGTVAAGMRVACRSDMMGEDHPDWKAINFVERSTDGKWIQVTGDKYEYGFVDIGLNQGSGPYTISMYGTWG